MWLRQWVIGPSPFGRL